MEIVDQIRQVANIIDIASQYTVIKKRGNKHLGLCPFHSEKTPSFTVDEAKQLYHCFGCGVGGDVFTLVMEKENFSFPEALQHLAERYHIALPEKKIFSKKQQSIKEQLLKIAESSLGFFKKNLFSTTEGEKALDYLRKRDIKEDTIQTLKIGYALNSWDSLLLHFQRKNINPDLLEKAGLVLRRQNKEGYYDRFRGRIIFPIFTVTGKTVAFGGRTIINQEPKYLNSPETPIYSKGSLLYGLNFCKDPISKKGEVILVEGYTDFLTLFQSGISNCAASLGTSLTAQQVLVTKRFAPKIISSFDGDSAGTNAAIRAISHCFENGVQINILSLPQGSDPDSFIKEYGSEQFMTLAKKSIPGIKFLIRSQLKGRKVESPEVKAKIAGNVLNEMKNISDPIVLSEYIKQMSELLDIDEGVLRTMFKQKKKERAAIKQNYFLPAEKRLLQILFFLKNNKDAAYVFEKIKAEIFVGLKSEPIFLAINEFLKEGKNLSLHDFKGILDASLFRDLSEMQQEKEQTPTPDEIGSCSEALKQIFLEKQRKKLFKQIRSLEKEEKPENEEKLEKILPLQKQWQEITKELSLLAKQN